MIQDLKNVVITFGLVAFVAVGGFFSYRAQAQIQNIIATDQVQLQVKDEEIEKLKQDLVLVQETHARTVALQNQKIALLNTQTNTRNQNAAAAAARTQAQIDAEAARVQAQAQALAQAKAQAAADAAAAKQKAQQNVVVRKTRQSRAS